jgi:hypothetical protein
MAILTIGRVGLDIELGHPSEASESRSTDSARTLNLRGWLLSGDLDNTTALRTELIEQLGQLVAVTYTLDPAMNGYYITTDVRIDFVLTSYRGAGAYRFECTLLRIGSDSRTELQSLLTGGVVTNSHSMTGDLWWATPAGALAINAGETAPSEHQRDSEDGTMAVLVDIDPDQDPTWSIPPQYYYNSAVKIVSQGRVRTGLDVKSDPTDWTLDNGIVRVVPRNYQASSIGTFGLEFHDGTAWSSTPIDFRVIFNNTNDIPLWHYFTIVRNTPELCIVRLVRDAATAPPSAHRHVLDLSLRRGAVFVSAVYTFTGPTAPHAVARAVSDPSNNGTGHIQDAGTIDGHKWVLGSPRAFTPDNSMGKIVLTAASRTLPFFVGAAILNAADGSNDGPNDIAQQYIGQVSETVRAVRR